MADGNVCGTEPGFPPQGSLYLRQSLHSKVKFHIIYS